MKKMPGHYIKMLHFLMDQRMNRELAELDLTSAQGRIIGYLARHEQAPCARDLETFFGLSHPTVSGILSRMEAKGFLEVYPDASDRRIKRIVLKEKGIACSQQIRANILANEARLLSGFTPEEQEQFRVFLSRAAENMCEKCVKREEPTDD